MIGIIDIKFFDGEEITFRNSVYGGHLVMNDVYGVVQIMTFHDNEIKFHYYSDKRISSLIVNGEARSIGVTGTLKANIGITRKEVGEMLRRSIQLRECGGGGWVDAVDEMIISLKSKGIPVKGE